MNMIDRITFGKKLPRIGSRFPLFCLDCMRMVIGNYSVRTHRGHDTRRVKEIVFT